MWHLSELSDSAKIVNFFEKFLKFIFEKYCNGLNIEFVLIS